MRSLPRMNLPLTQSTTETKADGSVTKQQTRVHARVLLEHSMTTVSSPSAESPAVSRYIVCTYSSIFGFRCFNQYNNDPSFFLNFLCKSKYMNIPILVRRLFLCCNSLPPLTALPCGFFAEVCLRLGCSGRRRGCARSAP